MTRVSQCSAGSHKPRRPGATPGPATCWKMSEARYANRQSGQVENLVCVGSSPTLVTQTNPKRQRGRTLLEVSKSLERSPSLTLRVSETSSVPSSNGEGAWPTPRRRWFDSIRDYCSSSVTRRTTTRACRSMGGCLPCKQAIRVRFPVGPLSSVIDPVVQRRRRLSDIQESDGSSPSGVTRS